MSKFIVRLTNAFSEISGAGSRTRAGITVPVGEGIEADLDKDQLKEIHEDQYLTVHDPKTGKLVTSKDEETIPTSTEAEMAQAPDSPSPEELAEQIKANNEAAAPKSGK